METKLLKFAEFLKNFKVDEKSMIAESNHRFEFESFAEEIGLALEEILKGK